MAENHVLLSRQTLSQSASSVTFSNIPQSGYTDLKIVMSARAASNVSGQSTVYVNMTINNDTGAYYDQRNVGASFGGTIINQSYSNQNAFYVYQIDASTATANTFSNTEIYIPNAFGTTNKSISNDGSAENNISTGTDRVLALVAGLYHPPTNTAISSLQFTTGGAGNFDTNSTFSLYGIAAVGTTPTTAPKATGGDVITNDGTYWIHQFLSSGTFTPLTNLSCDFLVVAGGGGGSYNEGGGGGAGGYRTSIGTSGANSSAESKLSLTNATAYTVTVGAGGTSNVNGNNSSISTITSTGGGAGSYNAVGQSGGSGGGGSYGNAGGSGTANQGRAGGVGYLGGLQGGGGGGGASGVGVDATSAGGGNGGNGLANSITGTSVTRAGGGGGGYAPAYGGGSSGTGGSGGGGNGGSAGGSNGNAGTVNTGSGGGGGAWNYSYVIGGPGGSGIVIVRYAMV